VVDMSLLEAATNGPKTPIDDRGIRAPLDL
jgi:hypothetical protein